MQLSASHLVEKFTDDARDKAEVCGGLRFSAPQALLRAKYHGSAPSKQLNSTVAVLIANLAVGDEE
jgi:hypothetical protein